MYVTFIFEWAGGGRWSVQCIRRMCEAEWIENSSGIVWGCYGSLNYRYNWLCNLSCKLPKIWYIQIYRPHKSCATKYNILYDMYHILKCHKEFTNHCTCTSEVFKWVLSPDPNLGLKDILVRSRALLWSSSRKKKGRKERKRVERNEKLKSKKKKFHHTQILLKK